SLGGPADHQRENRRAAARQARRGQRRAARQWHHPSSSTFGGRASAGLVAAGTDGGGAWRESGDSAGNRDRRQRNRSLARPDDRARRSSAGGPEGCWTQGRTQMMTSLLALNALNFFMADVRDGLGPFLGVFLQGKGWSPAEIGVVMTIGGYAGMIATTPLGALVDATKAKRGLMIASALAIIAASMMILVVPTFSATAMAQAINAIAGAAVGPAI